MQALTLSLAMSLVCGVSLSDEREADLREKDRTGEIEVTSISSTNESTVSTAEELREKLARAKLREVLPLAVATPTGAGYVTVGNQWTPVTKTVYSTYNWAPILPGHSRILVVKLRDANNGISSQNDRVRYRIYFPWPEVQGNTFYSARNYWGRHNEGGWTTFQINEAAKGNVRNPNPTGTHGEHYFQVQCRADGCSHRVYNASLLVYDVKD